MLGILFTLVDKPLLIQNSGLFVVAMTLCAIGTAVVISGCISLLRSNVETIAWEETVNEYERRARFADIVLRVEADLSL